MTGYELSRSWFDFCYENTSKITPTHTALFFFIVEHNNRLGHKKEFGLPRQMAMDAIGIKNNRTFTKCFEDLIDWNFIKVLERSKNQYSANIIALSKNTPATTKALDNAMLMHSQKQSTSNHLGIAPIDKHNNIRKEEPNKKGYGKDSFLVDWNELRTKHFKKPSFLNTLSRDEEENLRALSKDYEPQQFREALVGLFNQKKFPNDNSQMASNPKHILTHFNTYLTAFHDQNRFLYGKETAETL